MRKEVFTHQQDQEEIIQPKTTTLVQVVTRDIFVSFPESSKNLKSLSFQLDCSGTRYATKVSKPNR